MNERMPLFIEENLGNKSQAKKLAFGCLLGFGGSKQKNSRHGELGKAVTAEMKKTGKQPAWRGSSHVLGLKQSKKAGGGSSFEGDFGCKARDEKLGGGCKHAARWQAAAAGN